MIHCGKQIKERHKTGKGTQMKIRKNKSKNAGRIK
jgi:hypothetical protein